MKLKDKKEVSLTNDIIFKEALTSSENRDILIDFLNTVTGISKSVIEKDLIILNERLPKNNYYEKNMYGDVLVRFDKYVVNLEMYTYFNKVLLNKSFCYSVKIFSGELKEGDNYIDISKVIQVNLVNNIKGKFKSQYVLSDIEDPEDKIMVEEFIIKIYRIDNIKDKNNNLSREEKWMKFISAKTSEERAKISKGDRYLEKMNKWVDKYILSEADEKMFLDWKRQGYDEAIREEGAEQKNIEIAKILKEKGYDISEIIDITKLSEEEINKL